MYNDRSPTKKYIGQYLTKEKAIAALTLYNEKGNCMPSDNTNRRAGTWGITERNGRFSYTCFPLVFK